MEKLRKALDERLEKAKYTKRTGSPGNYKYEYGTSSGKGGKKREEHYSGLDMDKIEKIKEKKEKKSKGSKENEEKKSSAKKKETGKDSKESIIKNATTKDINKVMKAYGQKKEIDPDERDTIEEAMENGMKLPSIKQMKDFLGKFKDRDPIDYLKEEAADYVEAWD